MAEDRMTPQEAEDRLAQYAAFRWWHSGEYEHRPTWSVAQVAEALNTNGLGPVSDAKVRKWIDAGQLQAVDFKPPKGLVIYREDLAIFLATHLLPDSKQQAV
jgi:hypothetical protein